MAILILLEWLCVRKRTESKGSEFFLGPITFFSQTIFMYLQCCPRRAHLHIFQFKFLISLGGITWRWIMALCLEMYGDSWLKAWEGEQWLSFWHWKRDCGLGPEWSIIYNPYIDLWARGAFGETLGKFNVAMCKCWSAPRLEMRPQAQDADVNKHLIVFPEDKHIHCKVNFQLWIYGWVSRLSTSPSAPRRRGSHLDTSSVAGAPSLLSWRENRTPPWGSVDSFRMEQTFHREEMKRKFCFSFFLSLAFPGLWFLNF